MRRGDAYTRLLRRRILFLRREARESGRLDKLVDGPTGCSDSYDEAQRAWSRYQEAQLALLLYLDFKDWN